MHGRRVVQTDQQDLFVALQKKRQMEQRKERYSGRQLSRDPMELEFSQASVIMRLNRMKNILSGGKVVNSTMLQERMGDTLEGQKLYHNQLQA